MFDLHARSVVSRISSIPTLDPVDARRLLSAAYVEVVRIRGDASAADGRSRASILADLRRLASALESAAVFDQSAAGSAGAEIRSASAFVAGEALALGVDLCDGEELAGIVGVYDQVESSLLYLIGGFDINAVAVAQPAIALLAEGLAPIGSLLRAIAQFCCGNVSEPYILPPDGPGSDALASTRRRIVVEAIVALNEFRAWLVGEGGPGPPTSRISGLRDLVRGDVTSSVVPDLADLFHIISILAVAVERVSGRALISQLPAPECSVAYSRDFDGYRKRRASGDPLSGLRARPFLWPSATEFIEKSLREDQRDAVVTMPTGSGKSFLAELAVVHALPRGWVLYLTPTNALAHQVRRDLKAALKPFSGVRVAAFVGGSEYSTTADQPQASEGAAMVAVMTPERAALAIRTDPGMFEACALCVFDECHLLNDRSGRGALAELVLAHIFGAAPGARILLQSAMVANGKELADWVGDATGRDLTPSEVRWRPSRTARGFLLIDRSDYNAAKEASSTPLSKKGPFRATVGLGLIVGLSGPWTLDGPEDYRTLRLPIKVGWKRSRRRKGGMGPFELEDSSWKNGTGAQLASWLARSGLPTINFILSSKHHAFSAAERVKDAMPGAITEGAYPAVVESWLELAAAELGVESRLRHLFSRGVAVHTAALLQVEQEASEYMFTHQHTPLIFATGTLAQGLNLPSNAVVVSGSKVGDPRDSDAAAGLVRANELILNGFGRAGRPGFYNQSLVVLVSDRPYIGSLSKESDPRAVLSEPEYGVLSEEDASTTVTSAVETFIDDVLANAHRPESASESVFSMVSYLADVGQHEAGAILRRTFGGYRKRTELELAGLDVVSRRVLEVRESFLGQENVPGWLADAAGVAGVGFVRALRMWQAMSRTSEVFEAGYEARTVLDWLHVLVDVLSVLTPKYSERYGGDAKYDKTRLAIRTIQLSLGTLDDDPNWNPPAEWKTHWETIRRLAEGFMSGASYRNFGSRYLGVSEKDIDWKRSSGKIPQLIKVIGEVVEWGLAIDAGCFMALVEANLRQGDALREVPRALAILPLCLRHGCNSEGTLAWFRYGYRQRVAAHALAGEFPLQAITDDNTLQDEVRVKRQEWLARESAGEGPVLRASRIALDELKE